MASNAPSGFLCLFTQATPVLSEVLEFLPAGRDVVSVLLVSRRLFLVKRDDILHALLLKRFAAAWGSRDVLSKARLPTSFPRDDTLNLLQRSLSTDPVLPRSPIADNSGAQITNVSAECQYQYSEWIGFRHRPCQGCNCFPILPERWSCFHCGADLCKACRLQHPLSHVLVWSFNMPHIDFRLPHYMALFRPKKSSCSLCSHTLSVNSGPIFHVEMPKSRLSRLLNNLGSAPPSNDLDTDRDAAVCEACKDVIVRSGKIPETCRIWLVRSFPELVLTTAEAQDFPRTVWCDVCGRSVKGPVFKSISRVDYDMCENCFVIMKQHLLDQGTPAPVSCDGSPLASNSKAVVHEGFLEVRRVALDSFQHAFRFETTPADSTAALIDDPRLAAYSRLQLRGFSFISLVGATASSIVIRGLDALEGRPVAVKVALPGSSRAFPPCTTEWKSTLENVKQKVDRGGMSNVASYVKRCIATDMNGQPMPALMLSAVGMSLCSVLQGSARHIMEHTLIFSFARQILVGLAQLHQRNIVHGNLTSHNCIVREDATLYLVDDYRMMEEALGLRLPLRGQSVVGDDASLRRWLECTAPEVTMGEAPTAASDVFSCGTVIAQLVSARTRLEDVGADGGELLNIVQSWACDGEQCLPSFLRDDAEKGADVQTPIHFGFPKKACATLRSMMSLDPLMRPSCQQLLDEKAFDG